MSYYQFPSPNETPKSVKYIYSKQVKTLPEQSQIQKILKVVYINTLLEQIQKTSKSLNKAKMKILGRIGSIQNDNNLLNYGTDEEDSRKYDSYKDEINKLSNMVKDLSGVGHSDSNDKRLGPTTEGINYIFYRYR
jgi:hypothetical protein